jgi:type II secretion system protein L
MTHKQWHWFPSEAMSWQAVSLPKGRAWREALPFVVEEKLAESIEKLRIVPTPSDVDGQRWLAVIRDSFWQSWLTDDNAAICPDVLALPWTRDTGITAVIEGERVRLRWGQWQGAAGDMNSMTALLIRLQAQTPQPIQVYAHQTPTTWSVWTPNWHPLTAFVPLAPSFDLREGAGSAWFNGKQLVQWRLPITLASLLCLVWVSNTSVTAWQAQQQTTQLKQQTEAQFTAAFPEIKRRINPLVQAKSELKRRQAAQQQQSVSLMTALHSTQQALSSLPAVNQLSWQKSKLTLTWSQALSDTQRNTLHLAEPWQLRWLSPSQCEISQGIAP